MNSSHILQHPNASNPFQLYSNWSALGLKAILTHEDDIGKKWYVIIFSSRSHNNKAYNYSSCEGETLAIL